MSNPKSLPDEVNNAIAKWMGSADNILHFWEQDGTYFVVQQFELLYFLRLFKMGDEYAISQDHECEIGSGYIKHRGHGLHSHQHRADNARRRSDNLTQR